MPNDEINQEDPVSIKIKRADYPSLFQSADQASLSAQRCYSRFYLWHLLCLILGSVGLKWYPNAIADDRIQIVPWNQKQLAKAIQEQSENR